MRYEIAVLLRTLEEYHSRTGGYHPVDTATMNAAIEETRTAYRQDLPDVHEETIVEIIHARKVILLATALSDYNRDIAVALLALRLREQQKDEEDRTHPAFHINGHDERWKLLNFYGQLLEEEKDALFQLALDALRTREVLPPLPPGEQEDAIPHKAPDGQRLQVSLVLSAINKAKAIKDVRTIVVERQAGTPSDLYMFWCITDGAILDSFRTSELPILNRWLADHGLSSEDYLWTPM